LAKQLILLTSGQEDEKKAKDFQDATEKHKIMEKLIQEKEAHAQTSSLLMEQRAQLQQERDKIANLTGKVSELVQSHTATLKQLEEERENSRKAQEALLAANKVCFY
jgi:hypothetical protein